MNTQLREHVIRQRAKEWLGIPKCYVNANVYRHQGHWAIAVWTDLSMGEVPMEGLRTFLAYLDALVDGPVQVSGCKLCELMRD